MKEKLMVNLEYIDKDSFNERDREKFHDILRSTSKKRK